MTLTPLFLLITAMSTTTPTSCAPTRSIPAPLEELKVETVPGMEETVGKRFARESMSNVDENKRRSASDVSSLLDRHNRKSVVGERESKRKIFYRQQFVFFICIATFVCK